MKGGVTVGHARPHPHSESTRAKPECCLGYVMLERHVHVSAKVKGNHPKEKGLVDYPGCKCVDKSLFLRGKDSLMGICQGGVTGHCPSLNHETRSLCV